MKYVNDTKSVSINGTLWRSFASCHVLVLKKHPAFFLCCYRFDLHVHMTHSFFMSTTTWSPGQLDNKTKTTFCYIRKLKFFFGHNEMIFVSLFLSCYCWLAACSISILFEFEYSMLFALIFFFPSLFILNVACFNHILAIFF